MPHVDLVALVHICQRSVTVLDNSMTIWYPPRSAMPNTENRPPEQESGVASDASEGGHLPGHDNPTPARAVAAALSSTELVPGYDFANKEHWLARTLSARNDGLGGGSPRVIVDARYHDIALRVIAGQSVREIAASQGLATKRIRHMMMDPRLQEIYIRERDKIKTDISGLIKDEKAPSIVRKGALVTRAQTLLGEVMEAVHGHIQDADSNGGRLKATMLKAGVDASVAAFNHLEPKGGGPGATTNTINITADKAAFIQGVLRESGVDLSDVLDGYVTEQGAPVDGNAEATQ